MVRRALSEAYGPGTVSSRRVGGALAAILPLLVAGCDPTQIQAFQQSLQTQMQAAANGMNAAFAAPVGGVTSKSANVRSEPSTSAAAVGHTSAGRPLSVLARQDNWYQVAFADGQQPAAGWMRADLVTLSLTETLPQPGTVTRNVNLRAGPGGSETVIGSLSAGDSLSLLKDDGGWLKVRKGDAEGWASSQFVVAQLQTAPKPQAALTAVKGSPPVEGAADYSALRVLALKPNESLIEVAGYTKAFRGVRSMTRTGSFELAIDEIAKLGRKPTKDSGATEEGAGVIKASVTEDDEEEDGGFLGSDPMHLALERGTIALTHGDLDDAVASFADVEKTLEERSGGTIFADFVGSTGTKLASWITGEGELGPYELEPYEEILALNYKTIGHLLKGEHKAFNVARRASDRQNDLRDQFTDFIDSSPASGAEGGTTGDQVQDQQIAELQGWLAAITESYTAVGDRVPSAYVNPFGFYVVGMVYEIESYADPALRDNARIAYQKALELNDSSTVLKGAVDAMKSPLSSDDKKVVHVIAGVGMAPEKQLATYGMPLVKMNTVLPLKFPVYRTVPDIVARIEIRDGTGLRKLGELSSLADIEAMALRHQKDKLPITTAEFLLGVVPRIAEKAGLAKMGAFGNLVGRVRDTMTNPDLRAWLSLPARIQAARLILPRGQKEIHLVSFDERGRELNRQRVALESDHHGVVYARAIDKVLQTQFGAARWIREL